VAVFNSCSRNGEKKDIENTYYVDLVNFKKDSLENAVSNSLFGKVAYYKDNELKVMSLNYETGEYPNMHYFNSAAALGTDIEPETKKIRIELGTDNFPDSVGYSLQKFSYRNKQWVKTSDMGFITARTDYKKYIIEEFARQIMYNTILYTFDR
jgi:hypothetical protein